MTAAVRGHGVLVAEMPCQFTARAARVGDEVDDLADAGHVAFLPRFDVRVDGTDEVVLSLFALRERSQDAEAVYDTAGLELDGTNVVPLLQFPDRVCAGEAATSSSCHDVDVDSGPGFGGLAGLFDGVGNW